MCGINEETYNYKAAITLTVCRVKFTVEFKKPNLVICVRVRSLGSFNMVSAISQIQCRYALVCLNQMSCFKNLVRDILFMLNKCLENVE